MGRRKYHPESQTCLLYTSYERPALDDSFHIKKEDYFKENGGIIFANPNAPTGVELPLQDIEEILKANPGSVVIVDEAYIDFGAHSALPLISKYDNLLVVQTFSKSRSMAGMRIGFACGNPVLIKYLNDVKSVSYTHLWSKSHAKKRNDQDSGMEGRQSGISSGIG